jgi:hypothetical protein
MESGPGPLMDNTNRFRISEALACAELAAFHKSGWSKESLKIKSPMLGWNSSVWVGDRVGKPVDVLVGGNQMMVGVGVAVEESVGVLVGVGFKPEQAARSSPQAVRFRIKNRFGMMVSFIVLKT